MVTSSMDDPEMNFCMKSNHLSHWSLLSIQSQWFKIIYEEAFLFPCTCVFSPKFPLLYPWIFEVLCAIQILIFSSKNCKKNGKWKRKFQPHCWTRHQTPRHIGIIYNCNLLGDFEFDLDNIYQKGNMIVEFWAINR